MSKVYRFLAIFALLLFVVSCGGGGGGGESGGTGGTSITLPDPNRSGLQIEAIVSSGKVSLEGIATTALKNIPSDINVPFGALNLRITDISPGARVNVTVEYPINTLGFRFYKYQTGEWTDITSMVNINQYSVSYEITDGGPLDSDKSVNGEITDPLILGEPISNYQSWCNNLNQYNTYANELAYELKVPAIIIKAIMLQESNWMQWTCFNNEKKVVESYDYGIGIMQVTPPADCWEEGVDGQWVCPLGYINEGIQQGDNPFEIEVKNVIVNEDKLREDARYNIEIGTRILLAKKVESQGEGDDATILENWYYPLTYYNGFVRYKGEQDYCDRGLNDPSAPCYERNSSFSLWSKSNFPYQELIYNHIAGLSIDLLNPTLKTFFTEKIKVTLPGPQAICTGGGNFNYVDENFKGGDYITFKTEDTLEACGSELDNCSNANTSPGVKGIAIIGGNSLPVCVHKVLLTSTLETGTISGSVKDAVTQYPLEGVSIEVYSQGSTISTGTTDIDGTYFLSVPSGSGYTVEFTKYGYIPAAYHNVSVEADTTTYLETVLQIDTAYSGTGDIGGKIVNALDGSGVSGLTIKLRSGINVTSGNVVATTTTGSGGFYSFTDLNAGYYTAEVSGSGYNTTYFTVICIGGMTTGLQDATVTPILSSGETRIILTWGETPSDLDSHLTGPCPTDEGTSECQNGRFHLYFPLADENWGSYWPSYQRLDRDDVTSYGPETTTIYQQIVGVYRFSVHDYSNRDSSSSYALSNSGAQVRVYRGSNLVATFNVPTNQGGTLWTVFELSGDTITPINTMSYESEPSAIQTTMSGRSIVTDAELIRNLPSKR